MKTSQVPVQCVRACMGSWTPRDSDPSRPIVGSDAAFGSEKNLGIPNNHLSVLISPVHTRPCQRLTLALTDDRP